MPKAPARRRDRDPTAPSRHGFPGDGAPRPGRGAGSPCERARSATFVPSGLQAKEKTSESVEARECHESGPRRRETSSREYVLRRRRRDATPASRSGRRRRRRAETTAGCSPAASAPVREDPVARWGREQRRLSDPAALLGPTPSCPGIRAWWRKAGIRRAALRARSSRRAADPRSRATHPREPVRAVSFLEKIPERSPSPSNDSKGIGTRPIHGGTRETRVGEATGGRARAHPVTRQSVRVTADRARLGRPARARWHRRAPRTSPRPFER